MKRTSSAAGLLAAFLALAASPAGASPGNGIRLGGSEGRLHPFLDLEGRWDSNVTYSADNQAVADLIIHVRPGFQLTVPGALVAVDLAANLDWAQYLGIDESDTADDLSKLYAQASLALSVNRRGALGLELSDEFRRSPSTSALVFDGAVIANYNALRLKAPWRPGGGALVVSLTGGWVLETFEPYLDCPVGSTALACNEDLLGDLGYNEYRGGAEAKWRFLPRTSAIFEASYFSRAPNDSLAADDVSGLEVRAGVAGLVTPHLGATVKVGYADTLGSADESFRTWLSTVEVEWIATDAASVRAGWNHVFGVDPGSAFSVYTSNAVSAGAKYALDGRFTLRADLTYDKRTYELATGSPTVDLFRVEPSLDAVIAPWLTAGIGYAYTDRGASSTGAFSYSKSEAWLRLAFTY